MILVGRPGVVLGLGLSEAAEPAELWDLVALALSQARRGPAGPPIMLASTEFRASHPAVLDVAARLEVPILAFSAAEMSAVSGTVSIMRAGPYVGAASFAEAAALLGAGTGGHLVLPRITGTRVAAALAFSPGPRVLGR